MKDTLKTFSGWRYGAIGIITLFTALLIIRWQALPVFIDIYYHASCAVGFRDAGGVVLHDFWEYAPAGRPHLYPPLFHIIMLGLDKLGLPTLFMIRLVSAAIYPLLLAAILWVVAKLYNDRCAFFTVLAAALPYTFFLNAITSTPANIALIILILLFYTLETKRIFCGALLLGLSFYTHGGIPWITVFILTIYAIMRRENIKAVLCIILGGIALGSPWLIHMAGNKSYFLTVTCDINRYFEANICLYIFAVFGMFIALRRKGRYLFYVAMLVGMIPIIKNYTFRFLCGEGLLPIIFLAGVGLEEAYAKAASFLRNRTQPIVYTVLLPWAIFYFAVFYSPIISRDKNIFSCVNQGSSFLKFIKYEPEKTTPLELSIYAKKYMEELFSIIKANTRSDEIIYCNYGYVGGIFYIFSGRAASGGMLNEVRPIYDSDPALPAALFVWIKNPEGYFEPELDLLIKKLRLVKRAETEFAYVYRNPVVMAHKTIARPIVSSTAAFLILTIWIFLIVRSLVKR